MPPVSPVVTAGLVLARTRLLHSASARELLITYACKNNTGGTNPTTIANSLQSAFATQWVGQLDNSVTMGPTTVRIGQETTVLLYGVSTSANTAATRALSSPPPNNNAVIKKSTGLTGPANRGRLYLPYSFDEAGVDEVGVLTAGEVSGMQTRANAWLAALTTATLPLYLANRTLNGLGQVTAITLGQAVTALTVQSLIGSRRSRIGR